MAKCNSCAIAVQSFNPPHRHERISKSKAINRVYIHVTLHTYVCVYICIYDPQRHKMRCSEVNWNHVEEPFHQEVCLWWAGRQGVPLCLQQPSHSCPGSTVFLHLEHAHCLSKTQVQPLANKFSSQICNVPHQLAEWAQLACAWLYGYLQSLWQIILLQSAHICQGTDLIWSYGFTWLLAHHLSWTQRAGYGASQ